MNLTPQSPPDRPDRPRVIKRYANRKLYDTRDSRYVTLQQIAEYVRSGEEVSVIDNATKEDLTNVTLAQIVYEEERKNALGSEGAWRASPTVGALRTLIQQGGERLMATLRGIAHSGGVGKLVRRDGGALSVPAPELEGASGAADAQARHFLSPKEAWEELQRLADDRMKAALGAAITHVQQLQNEVRRLQARIEELERKLAARSARRGAGASSPQSTSTQGEAGGG